MTAQTVILRDTEPMTAVLREQKVAAIPIGSADQASTKRAVVQARAEADRAYTEATRSETARSGAEAAEVGTIAALAGVTLTTAILTAATRIVMAALDTSIGLPAMLLEGDRFGVFDLVDYSTLSVFDQVDADGSVNFIYLRSTDDATKAWRRRHNGIVTPGYAGAAGDGITNDTVAFQTIANWMNDRGGGIVVEGKAGATYVVGLQDDHSASPTQFDGTGSGPVRWTAQDIFKLTGCSNFELRFNDSLFKIADNLKHGSFNADGTPMASSNGYTGVGAASAVGAIIYLTDCHHFTIDSPRATGNTANINKGGPWGDTGYQCGGSAIAMIDCTDYTLNRPYCYDNLSDGLQIAGPCTGPNCLSENGEINNGVFELNSRQGLSLIGGKGITFNRSSFSFNGKSTRTGASDTHIFQSAPSAGVDVEAEGAREVHDVKFNACVFYCNFGAGFLYAGGGCSGLHFTDCVFIADTSAALYSAALMSGARFTRCIVVGASIWQGPDIDAAQFKDCHFLDDASLSPTGVVNDAGRIIDFGGSGAQVLLDNCTIKLTGDALLPSGTVGVTFRDCTLSQTNPTLTGFGGAKLEGRTSLSGNLDMGNLDTASTTFGLFFDNLSVNGTDASVTSDLLNFHGARVRGVDGSGTPQTYRLGFCNDVSVWAAIVGGANVGDIVIDTNIGTGFPYLSICNTAPGDTSAKWTRMGYKGQTTVANVGGLGSGDTLAVVIDRFNDLITKMRSAHHME